ncbi:multidrug transporter [Luteipulveratus mongoliensis]|uniref:Multidrug transporter n=1 Tax=Luteipulveratus mongoliensis TaxID=571913 RepID=A0A0K1JPY9_9MICO|nr:multidrug transporter [Luteipulveratus mongoliensis]
MWRVACVVVFGAFMGTLDTSLVNIGLESIGKDLHASLDSVQWIGSGYLLAMAVALPACSWLGRRVGAGRLWLSALAAFTLMSALCAIAPNIEWMIALRVLQGLSAGLLVPTGQSILGQVAGPQRLGRVMSTLGLVVVGAPAIGPAVGGVMLENLSWPWLFAINVPIGAVGLALGFRYLPRDDGSAAGPLDVTGLLLSAAGLSLVLYAVGEVGRTGSITGLSSWLPLVLGVVALVAFIRRSWARPHAILNLELLRNRVFASATAVSCLMGAALFGTMLLLPLYFLQLHDKSLIDTGLTLIPFGLGGALTMPVAGRIVDRVGSGIVVVCGSAMTLVTVVPFALLGASASAATLGPLLFVNGVAIGLAAMPATTAAYKTVQRSQMPDASALVNIAMRLGGALGAALLAVVLYRGSASGLSLETSFHRAYWCLSATCALALVASAFLWRTLRNAR